MADHAIYLAGELAKLRQDAEVALKEAHSQDYDTMGAVNWGDLGVLDVYRAEHDGDPAVGGFITWHVCIEEADPAAPLREWIESRLRAKGWKDVFVHTEW